MKNLLIYTGPQKEFDEKTAVLAKIQIDNSLDLGWNSKDMLLVTDFDFSYNGVKSYVLKRDIYYDFDLKANKIPVALHLIDCGFIEPDELYFCHDFDAYEHYSLSEDELGLNGFDMGLTHYTYKPEWQGAVIFFTASARDILALVDETTRRKPHLSRNNEKTLTKLIKQGAIAPQRYKRLNPTYNIMKKYLPTIYPIAEKPLKILHFNPWEKSLDMPETTLNIFMYGKNRLKIPLMSARLIKLFHHHGIK